MPNHYKEYTFNDSNEQVTDGYVIIRFINSVLRHRRLVVFTIFMAVILVAGRTLLKPPMYTANASFVPATASASLPALGVAAQLGLAIPNSGSSESPEFYVDLIRSREILGEVVNAKYPLPGASLQSGTLADVYKITAGNHRERNNAARKRLQSEIRAESDPRTGVIAVTVTTRQPALSKAIVEQVLAQVIRFNRERRRSKARAEREFTEQRLSESENALSVAEKRQREFQEKNRDLGSPALRIEQERLNREVLIRQQLHFAMAQAHEQAKIEEIRDSPIVTIIENPEESLEPDPRGLGLGLALASLLGGLLGATLAILVEYFRGLHGGAQSPELAELRALCRRLLADLRHIFSFLNRRK